MSLDLDKEIDETLARLLSGEDDHREILRDFANRVRSGQVTRLVKACVSCGAEEAPCFLCAVREHAGDQAVELVQNAVPQLGRLAAEKLLLKIQDTIKQRRVTRESTQQPPPPPTGYRPHPPPPPAGPQRF